MKSFDYIHKMIPVLWDPGHMGTFLLRVLVNDYIKNSNAAVREYFNHEPSYEWSIEDRLGTPWNSKSPANIIKQQLIEQVHSVLKKNNLTDNMYLALIHILLQLSKDYFTADGLSKKSRDISWPASLSEKEILDLYYSNSTDGDSVFPYFKHHFSSYFKSKLSYIPFEKIVIAEFPADKSWLAEVLLFYKQYWFWKGYNAETKGIDSVRYTIQKLENTIMNKPIIDRVQQARIKNLISQSNTITIDMYDLIFNQNVDQLLQIRPDIKLDESLVSLLNLAKAHTTKICSLFDLDHSTRSSLATPRLLEAIDIIKNKLGP